MFAIGLSVVFEWSEKNFLTVILKLYQYIKIYSDHYFKITGHFGTISKSMVTRDKLMARQPV